MELLSAAVELLLYISKHAMGGRGGEGILLMESKEKKITKEDEGLAVSQ